MKGFTASPRLMLLAALALPGLALAQDAAPDTQAAAPTSVASEIVFLAGRVNVPLALHERERELVRQASRGLITTENVRFDAPDGQTLRLMTTLMTARETSDSALAAMLVSLTDANAREPGVHEVRRVDVGGHAFHLIRRQPMWVLEGTGAVAPPADDPESQVRRGITLTGAIRNVIVRIDLRIPASLEEHEPALAEALLGLELDLDTILGQREAFERAAAKPSASGAHGALPRSGG